MSPLASSTPTSSPDPINDLVFTPPPDAALPPSNQHQHQHQQQRVVYAQQAMPLFPSVRPPAKTRPVKVERSSQTVSGNAAESGSAEDEPDEDAQEGFGRSREEEQEVEQAVASNDGGGGAAADGAAVDDLTVKRSDDKDGTDKKSEVEEVEEQWKDLRPDWGEERLEDEMRPLKLDATFSEPLRRYQLQQEDIVQDYMRGMFACMLQSEVWATTYLRNQSEAHAQQLDKATARIAEEEVYQENMRQNLLRVKEQVQNAMEHLAGMQSLALVRIHQRSESAEPRSAPGGARKKARTQ